MANNAIENVLVAFPWMRELNITPLLTEMIQANPNVSDEAILSEIRRSPEHAMMFPSLFRPNGTLRMTEATYQARLDDYKAVHAQFGGDPNQFGAFEMAQLLENEVGVDEFRSRRTLYNEVQRAGRDIRDAFYVYAGLRLSNDDLYEYIVDGDVRSRFDQDYNRRVTASPVDYDTFITRATEAGLERVVEGLEDLQAGGIEVGSSLMAMRNIDPAFARQMADVLYQGTEGTPLGSLVELENTFQAAMIGAAASQQGLVMPERERIEAFRSAGVDRARALEGYSMFARQGEALRGQIQRLNQGQQFTQELFEEAVFLQSATAEELLGKAQAREQAFGRAQGSAALQMRGAQLQQAGLSGMF